MLPRSHERGGAGGSLSSRRGRSFDDRHGDPMESMGNLFDVSILLAVGFLVVALSGFGLKELVSGEDVTIVKNPGTANMELITKEGNQMTRLSATGQTAEGSGQAVGTVYKLQNGQMVWVPGTTDANAAGGSAPATPTP